MQKKAYIIAINAISGGGKTTITKKLKDQLPNAVALYFDDRNYDLDSGIDDICKWIDEGADANRFNLDLLINDIEILKSNGVEYIILDYPFGYRHHKIATYINLSIFIDTPLDIALARRIIRDYDRNMMLNIFDDMKQYLSKGRNAYLSSINSALSDADFIVDGSKSANDIVYSIKNRIFKINNLE